MIQSPTNNITITSEQSEQIEFVKAKLSLLESEISIANNTIKNLKSEITALIKEKGYQEELLDNANKTVLEQQAKKIELATLISEASSKLDEITSQTKKIIEESEVKAVELKNREENVFALEEKNNLLFDENNKLKAELLKEKSDIETVKVAFKKAIETVSW